ncbi:MAG: XylR N-terminal domain-containing protein [Bacillota bacterium]|nr:XylR N-terminal domain-containing protein [Bacillota bacterium]
MKIKISEDSYKPRTNASDRKLLASATAFGILRQQLVEYIGIERIKGFLFHFGWQMGVADAKEAMKTDSSLEYLIKQGPIFHITNGHISGMKHDCEVKLDEQKKMISILGKGIWIDSYEADQHVNFHGISNEPVCHTLTGYASGYMSTISGQTLHAKELTCVGMGDHVCSWEVKPQEEWEKENEIASYNEIPIVKELEFTYEQLLEQQNFVTRLASFQKELTEEVSNGSNLQEISDLVYNLVKIPIIIEDIDHRTISFSGLSEEKYLELKADLETYIRVNASMNFFQRKEKQRLPFRKKTVKTIIQERLITPILVQKELIGYCHFIYEDVQSDQHEEDYLFLDRFANAASLILLNEKTSFTSFERMKGSFFEQILEGRLPINEIIKRGKYTGLDLGLPYYITVMEYKRPDSTIEEEFLFQEQIFETTFHYFNEKKYNVLVSQRDGKMILFITKDNFKHTTIINLIKDYREYMVLKYPKSPFKFGISNLGEDITTASKNYEEAMIALRLTISKEIVPFKSLGIVGVLINSNNISGIRMIAEQELGPLYNTGDLKTVELLKTLYIFLLNGGKLEQTMNELALSMSGLRHRIKKIESLLEKDLRDPNESHQLILIIKSLIALGELNIE